MSCPPSANMFMIRAPFRRTIGTDFSGVLKMAPTPWRSRAGGGAVHSINTRHSGTRLGWPSAGFVGGGPSPFDILYRFLHAR
jgi:hypothetical protein